MVSLLSDKKCWMNSSWTSSPAQNRAPSKRRNRQECDPKGSLEKYLRMKNLINNNLKSDWLNPDLLWTNKKTSQRHDTSCNRPPQSRQNESNDPLVLTAKNMFSLRSPCRSTNNNWQTLCCTCHSHTEKTAHREETKRISSRHSGTEVCQMNSSPTSPVMQHTDQQTSQTNQKHESNI